MTAAGLLTVMGLFALLAMIVPGIVLIVRSGRGRRPHSACGRCGYDLTGFVGTSEACPECGSRHVDVGILPARPRRRRGLLAWGIILVVVPLVVGSLGAGSWWLARIEAQREAQERQRMARISVLEALQGALVAELAKLGEELKSIEDEAAAANLEAKRTAIQHKLDETTAELEVLMGEQEGE